MQGCRIFSQALGIPIAAIGCRQQVGHLLSNMTCITHVHILYGKSMCALVSVTFSEMKCNAILYLQSIHTLIHCIQTKLYGFVYHSVCRSESQYYRSSLSSLQSDLGLNAFQSCLFLDFFKNENQFNVMFTIMHNTNFFLPFIRKWK